MLKVDGKPVKAEAGHYPRQGYTGQREPCPQRRFPSFEFFFYLVVSHDLPSFLLVFLPGENFCP
jgi:hypothetical protein